MSLFTRLLFLMIGVGIVPLAPTAGVLIYYQSQAKRNTLSLHDSLSSLTAVSVRHYMESLPARMAFTERLESSPKPEAVLKDALSANSDFLLAAVLDEEGRETVKVGTLAMLRRFGSIDAGADPAFLRSRKTGRVVYGNFDAQYGEPIAAMIFPVGRKRSLFTVVSFSPLWSRLQKQNIGSTGRIFLADEDGKIYRFAGDFPPTIEPAFLKKAFAGYKTRLDSVPASEGIFAGAFRRVPDANLFVLTLQSREEAFWGIRMATSLIIFFLLAIATASYFSALFFARKLGEPIAELIAGADRVSARDFATEVDPKKGWGELSGLIDAFNLMMREEKRYDALQLDRILGEKKKTDLLMGLMRDGVVLSLQDGSPLFMNAAAERCLGGQSKETIKKLAAGREEVFCSPSGGHPRYYKAASETFTPRGEPPVTLLVLRDVTLERELDAVKEEFFNSVAHDLRAPLMGLQGYLKLLEESCKGEEQEYIAAMKRSSSQLFSLVEDILDIARMESGALRPRLRKFDLEKTAERVVESLSPLASAKKLSVAVEPAADSSVVADERLVERVLSNLLSNSVKFTPDGGKITVGWSSSKSGWEIRVSDTGIGIPEDKLETIFEKYRRALPEHEGEGYGLGLAISKKIAELHGGSIRAVSREGEGAEVIFSLPKREA